MNKPVAWMYRVNNSFNTFSTIEPPDDAYDEGTLTALYTHPVKENYMDEILNNTLNMERNHNEKAYKELYDLCVKQQAEIEALKNEVAFLRFIKEEE